MANGGRVEQATSAVPMDYTGFATTVQQRIERRIASRKNELYRLSRSLPMAKKRQATIEVKTLNLVEVQRRVRREVLRSWKEVSGLHSITSRHVHRRPRVDTLRDAGLLEQQQRLDGEARKRAAHVQVGWLGHQVGAAAAYFDCVVVSSLLVGGVGR